MLQENMEDVKETRLNDEERFREEVTVTGSVIKKPNFVYKLKIVLGFFQIAVGIAFAVEIPWPDDFKSFISLFNIANFDLVQWTRVGCVVKSSFYFKHTVIVFLPLSFFLLIVSGYLLPKYVSFFRAKFHSNEKGVKAAKLRFKRGIRKFWKMFLFTLFLIYPSVSSIIIRLYSCHNIEGVSYLKADYEILCDSEEWRFRALWNIAFVLLYPIGIFVLFATVLVSYERRLNDVEVMIQFGFIYGAYHKNCWWFELLDMSHKLFMTSIVALIPSQFAVPSILITLLAYTVLILLVSPYARPDDDQLHLLSQSILITMVSAGYIYSKLNTIDSSMEQTLSMIFKALTIMILLALVYSFLKGIKKVWESKKRSKRRKISTEMEVLSKIRNQATTTDISTSPTALKTTP